MSLHPLIRFTSPAPHTSYLHLNSTLTVLLLPTGSPGNICRLPWVISRSKYYYLMSTEHLEALALATRPLSSFPRSTQGVLFLLFFSFSFCAYNPPLSFLALVFLTQQSRFSIYFYLLLLTTDYSSNRIYPYSSTGNSYHLYFQLLM